MFDARCDVAFSGFRSRLSVEFVPAPLNARWASIVAFSIYFPMTLLELFRHDL